MEHYNSLLQLGRETLPDLLSDGIITPKALGELVARVSSYSLLDLHYYPRNNVVSDILMEEQMAQNRCVLIPKHGHKAHFVVSDPIQIQNFRKIALPSGLSVDLVVIPDDQFSSLLGWLGQCSTTTLKGINEEHEAT